MIWGVFQVVFQGVFTRREYLPKGWVSAWSVMYTHLPDMSTVVVCTHPTSLGNESKISNVLITNELITFAENKSNTLFVHFQC